MSSVTVEDDERIRMLLADGRFSYTPGDLRAFAQCQLAALRQADALLGRGDPIVDDDLMGRRMGEQGSLHQERVLQSYVDRYGLHDGAPGGVAMLAGRADPSGRAAADAMRMLDERPNVIAQFPISAGPLCGAADLLVRSHDRWQLAEIRLGLRVKDVYLLQIGAIALALLSRGVPLEPEALLIAGNENRIDVPLIEAMDRARSQMALLDAALARRLADRDPASWEDVEIRACGWCATCRAEMTAVRDARLTAGVRMPDRELLRAAGIRTIDELAVAHGPVAGIEPQRLEAFRAQARLQVRQMPPGSELDETMQLPPVFEVYDSGPLHAMPDPDEGDIFFDLESDPMWDAGDGPDRGLHYLFGMWLPDYREPYVTLWAHDRGAERQALLDFIDLVEARHIGHPGLHIYHYGNYEVVVLRELTRRHEVAGERLEALLGAGVFIDLLPVVKGSIRTSQSGYGLKKLEPLYMIDEPRTGGVLDGAASIVGYERYTALRSEGKREQARALLAEIAHYNRYDCLSTLRLRDWLRALR